MKNNISNWQYKVEQFYVLSLCLLIWLPRGIYYKLLFLGCVLIASHYFISQFIDKGQKTVNFSKYLSIAAFPLSSYLYIKLFFGQADLQSTIDSGLCLILFALGVIPFFSRHFFEKETRLKIFGCFSLIISLVSIHSLLQYFGILPVTDIKSVYEYLNGASYFRTTVFFPHATALSIFSIVATLISYYGIIHYKYKNYVWPSFILTCTLSICTFGRTSLALNIFMVGTLVLARNSRVIFRPNVILTALAGLLILGGVAYSERDNNMYIKRFAKAADTNTISSQRKHENILGFELASKNLWGYGVKNIESAANEIINSNWNKWEFKKWRGLHNFYLTNLVLWGLPSIVLLLLSFLGPLLIFNNFKIRSKIYFYLLGFSFFVYGFTDSFVYAETSLFLVLGFYFFATNKEDYGSVNDLKLTAKQIGLLAVILVGSMQLPTIRKAQINSYNINLARIFNNSEKTESIQLDKNNFTLESKTSMFYYTINSSFIFNSKSKNTSIEFSDQGNLKVESNSRSILTNSNVLKINYFQIDKEHPYYTSFCWEPIIYTLKKDLYTSACNWEPHVGSYGAKVIGRQLRYLLFLVR